MWRICYFWARTHVTIATLDKNKKSYLVYSWMKRLLTVCVLGYGDVTIVKFLKTSWRMVVVKKRTINMQLNYYTASFIYLLNFNTAFVTVVSILHLTVVIGPLSHLTNVKSNLFSHKAIKHISSHSNWLHLYHLLFYNRESALYTFIKSILTVPHSLWSPDDCQNWQNKLNTLDYQHARKFVFFSFKY